MRCSRESRRGSESETPRSTAYAPSGRDRSRLSRRRRHDERGDGRSRTLLRNRTARCRHWERKPRGATRRAKIPRTMRSPPTPGTPRVRALRRRAREAVLRPPGSRRADSRRARGRPRVRAGRADGRAAPAHGSGGDGRHRFVRRDAGEGGAARGRRTSVRARRHRRVRAGRAVRPRFLQRRAPLGARPSRPARAPHARRPAGRPARVPGPGQLGPSLAPRGREGVLGGALSFRARGSRAPPQRPRSPSGTRRSSPGSATPSRPSASRSTGTASTRAKASCSGSKGRFSPNTGVSSRRRSTASSSGATGRFFSTWSPTSARTSLRSEGSSHTRGAESFGTRATWPGRAPPRGRRRRPSPCAGSRGYRACRARCGTADSCRTRCP